jgi:hypothetical protein
VKVIEVKERRGDEEIDDADVPLQLDRFIFLASARVEP